ncbi:MAG TPA: D-arabinono-1,4-lactone oxidase [Bryobacteraceae bacterium]|nr:D-arabinono-1,4-lactone oxidase [Bryobacteraceae bacterium]
MNKRTFLNLLASGAASGMLQPFSADAANERLSNWSGNLAYGTDRLAEASSADQVRSFVKSRKKFKVLGTRHCFNSIADSHDEFLSLKPMQEMLIVGTQNRMVAVGPGVTYGQLAPFLESKELALHNLASLPHISVAGAVTTATHGSGEGNGNLSTAVAEIEMVTGDGDVAKLSRADTHVFPAAVVGLGALGVITRVVLDVQPTYQVRQYVYENLPFSQMRDHFDAIQASGYSVSLFTDWRNERVNEVWIKARTDASKPFAAPAEFYGARLATRNLHPIAELSAENCTEQLGKPGPWYDRLPHFKMGFTPSAGKELQTEYFVPRRHAMDAIMAVARLHEQVSPLLLITEIRTIAADDLWMSPAYQRPSVAIHFTWKQDWPAVQRLLPVIERELGPYQPRPHWGKLFTVPHADLRARYPKFDDFVKLASKFDAQGRLRNEFLNTNIFAS